MLFYFKLRYRILRRTIEETGLPFLLGVLLIGLFFIILYKLALTYPAYLPYPLLYLALYFLFQLANASRLDFLKNIYPTRRFVLIRIYEHIFCMSPLMLIACIAGKWKVGLVLLGLSFVFSVIHWEKTQVRALPTPFRKYPFEFIVLFRRMWPVLIIFYVLIVIGIIYKNANLSLVVSAVMMVTALSAYDVMEDVYIIWNYASSPRAFLRQKIIRGCLQILVLTAPAAILLLVYFFSYMPWILLGIVLCLFLLALTVLMKYAVYPRRVGLMEAFIFMGAAIVPLAIVGLFPYYYKKSVRNLQAYL